MNPFSAFWLYLKASLITTGGMGNLPVLHADFLARHWATERQFAESLLIGQIAPGPNGFWVISLGYLTDGVRGAALAAVAIPLPPLLVLVADRAYQRVKDHPAMEGFLRGLSLAVTGVFVVVLVNFFRTIGADARSLEIATAAVVLAVTRRVPFSAILALAALAGIALR